MTDWPDWLSELLTDGSNNSLTVCLAGWLAGWFVRQNCTSCPAHFIILTHTPRSHKGGVTWENEQLSPCYNFKEETVLTWISFAPITVLVSLFCISYDNSKSTYCFKQTKNPHVIHWIEFIIPSAQYRLWETPMLKQGFGCLYWVDRLFLAPAPKNQGRRWHVIWKY